MTTGVGPDLPGPRLRELVGAVEPFAPCTPDPERVRPPANGTRPPGLWRRGDPAVGALANEEIRATAIDGRIYVGTGVRANERGTVFSSLRTVFLFDPADGRYERLPDLPQPLDHTEMATWGGNLYVFGGFTDERPSGRLWRYSPRTRTWRRLASMKQPRGGLSGAVIGDSLYAAGGHLSPIEERPRTFATVEIYDFRTNSWSKAAPMPTARHHVGATALDGKLYVVGGRNDDDLSLASVERFDPATGSWERLPPLPQGSGGLATVTARGRVVAIGGGDDGERWVTPATWAFDPAQNRWSRLADLAVPRHGHGAAVAQDRIHVFGGAPCPGYGRTDETESLALDAVR